MQVGGAIPKRHYERVEASVFDKPNEQSQTF